MVKIHCNTSACTHPYNIYVFFSKGTTKRNACKLSSMQLYHFMFGSGMEILTCMFGLEATCWETGRKIMEIFKLIGKHVNTDGVNSIVVGYISDARYKHYSGKLPTYIKN